MTIQSSNYTAGHPGHFPCSLWSRLEPFMVLEFECYRYTVLQTIGRFQPKAGRFFKWLLPVLQSEVGEKTLLAGH